MAAGQLQAVSRTVFGQVVRTATCDTCQGRGRIPSEPCERCGGSGHEMQTHELSVDVPAGIEDGQRIRVSGRGHAGEHGGPPGDLYLLVSVTPDPRFERHGTDLVTRLDVPFTDAALGAHGDDPDARGRRRAGAEARHPAGHGRCGCAAAGCPRCAGAARAATCTCSST